MRVKDCMCDNVCFVRPDTKIGEVAKLMAENHIGCVPVCDNENIVCGILTDRDILLRCVACDKDANKIPVSDVMSLNVYTCKENDDITNAQMKMDENQVRRLPVCDDNNKVIGILTIGDLAQNNQQLAKEQINTTMKNICDCERNKNAE